MQDPLIRLRQSFINCDIPSYAFDCGLFPKIESNDKLEFEQKIGKESVNKMNDALIKRISDLLNKNPFGSDNDIHDGHTSLFDEGLIPGLPSITLSPSIARPADLLHALSVFPIP